MLEQELQRLQEQNNKLQATLEAEKRQNSEEKLNYSNVLHELRGGVLNQVIFFSGALQQVLQYICSTAQPLLVKNSFLFQQLNNCLQDANNLNLVAAGAEKLVKRMLNLAKLSHDPSKLDISSCTLESLCTSIIREAKCYCDPAKVKLTIVKDNIPAHIKLFIDESCLKQILIIFISNSCKFVDQTGAGRVDVHFSLHPVLGQADNMKGLHVRVEDNGHGIPEAKRTQLFQAFQQVNAQDASIRGGTGLGLALAKKLIEQLYKGTLHLIEAAKCYPTGTIMSFTLPCEIDGLSRTTLPAPKIDFPTTRFLYKVPSLHSSVEKISQSATGNNLPTFFKSGSALRASISTELPQRSASLSAGQVPPLNRSRTEGFMKPRSTQSLLPLPRTTNAAKKTQVRILIAEDNEVNQTILKRMLDKNNYDLEIVANGQQVCNAYYASIQTRKSTFSAILMDVQMPGIDGLTATRLIREYERTSNLLAIPIIAMTADTQPKDIKATEDAGMTKKVCVSKPINRLHLKQVLEEQVAIFQSSQTPHT